MIAGFIVAAVVIVAVVAVLLKNKSGKNLFANEISVDTLSMADAISLFKKEKNLTALKENQNLIAVLIKEDKGNQKNICAALFDKNTNKIQDALCKWTYKNLDDDLKNAFGEKNMIVLQ